MFFCDGECVDAKGDHCYIVLSVGPSGNWTTLQSGQWATARKQEDDSVPLFHDFVIVQGFVEEIMIKYIEKEHMFLPRTQPCPARNVAYGDTML